VVAARLADLPTVPIGVPVRYKCIMSGSRPHANVVASISTLNKRLGPLEIAGVGFIDADTKS